ncbi:MAG: hypothetical protein JNK64_31680 [Myxococcales bacterium]|nr:hypothetical protein [Myxococcales bacterium]
MVRALAVFASLVMAASAATADDAHVSRLPPGQIRIAAVEQRSLAPASPGAPWSLAIDAVVGVTSRLSLGLSHSALALGRARGGGGWCRQSDAHVCAASYAGGYLDARWAAPGLPGIDLLARLGVDGVAPWKPVVRLGAAVGRRAGRWWWGGQAEVAIALGNRARGNGDAVVAPLWGGRELGRVAVWMQSGLRGPIDDFDEAFEIPVLIGASTHVGAAVVGARAGFAQLLGPQNSANLRAGEVWLAWTR